MFVCEHKWREMWIKGLADHISHQQFHTNSKSILQSGKLSVSDVSRQEQIADGKKCLKYKLSKNREMYSSLITFL